LRSLSQFPSALKGLVMVEFENIFPSPILSLWELSAQNPYEFLVSMQLKFTHINKMTSGISVGYRNLSVRLNLLWTSSVTDIKQAKNFVEKHCNPHVRDKTKQTFIVIRNALIFSNESYF
jgi:hypothetical protein